MNNPLTEDKIQHVDYSELFSEKPLHIATTRVVRLLEIASAVQGLKEEICTFKSRCYESESWLCPCKKVDKWFLALVKK